MRCAIQSNNFTLTKKPLLSKAGAFWEFKEFLNIPKAFVSLFQVKHYYT